MANVHDIATALTKQEHAADHKIDNQQLHHLLYLTQGAAIARLGRPAFRATFRAAHNGPTVHDPSPNPTTGDPSNLDNDTAEVIDEILNLFGHWPLAKLQHHTTHDDTPWRHARTNTPDDLAPEISTTDRRQAVGPC